MHGGENPLRRARLIAALALVAVGYAPPAAAAPHGTVAARSERAVLELLNDARERRGLRPLSQSTELARAAQRHASDMAARSYFAHESLDGRTFADRIRSAGYLSGFPGRWKLAENLAWATGDKASARPVVAAWMDSSGHRRNILDRTFRQIGFGLRKHDGRTVYVTEFGARGGS